jgi:hypothetical protein
MPGIEPGPLGIVCPEKAAVPANFQFKISPIGKLEAPL